MGLALMRLAFSLAFAAAGLYVLANVRRAIVRRNALAARGLVAEGRVVAFESRSSSSSGTTAYRKYIAPVIAFTSAAGQPVRFTASTARSTSPYALGDRVAVRYLAEDAKGADVEGDAIRWLPIVLMGVMGIVALVCATLPWVLRR